MVRTRAFTVLELLVVVTVLAILASLVLSMMGMVRQSARTVVCANNLRQVGMLYEAFASDHRGMYPPAYIRNDMKWLWPADPLPYPTGSAKTKWENAARGVAMGAPGESEWGNWSAWLMYLAPYANRAQADQYATSANSRLLSLEGLYNCPAAPLQVRIDRSLDSAGYKYKVDGNILRAPYGEWLAMSYGANTAVLGVNESLTRPGGGYSVWANWSRGVAGWPGYGVGISGLKDNARARSRFSNPSGIIQVAEHWGGLPTSAQGNKFRVFWSDAPFARPAVDGAGAALPLPSGWAWTATAAGMWPWTSDGFDGWALRASHRGRSNYLFVDGHVAAHTPWDLCPDGDPVNAPAWTGRF